MASGKKTALILLRRNEKHSCSNTLIAFLCVCACVWLCRLVHNLSSSKEGWIAAANLISLIEKSKSCQSLTSSGIHTNSPT